MTTKNNGSSIATNLLDIFGGNPYYAIGKKRADGQSAWYEPVWEPLTEELLQQHLKGEVIIGSYPVSHEDHTVKWLGWDIDAADNIAEARRLTITITNAIQHLPYVVEFSGGKGYHVLLFLTEPMPANKAKAYAEHIRDQYNLPKIGRKGQPHVECYPKQAQLTSQSPNQQKMGNLLKVPLGQHILTQNWSRFVDMSNGWEDGPSLPPEELLTLKVDPKILIVEEGETDRIEKLAYAIASEWEAGERHNIALFLAGYLASSGWSQEQATDLMERICTYRNDPEIENRLQAVNETFQKAAKGEKIAGYQRLADILPATTMGTVIQLVSDLASPDTAKRIEKIRFAKGPVWKKEDKASALIWSHLTDPEIGRILRTPHDEFFWFNVQERTTVNMRSQRWEAVLYKLFRLNTSEAFGRHIQTIIELKARMEATLVRLYRGSYWDGHTLLVNLGDDRVWRITGDGIDEERNGESNIIFQTDGYRKYVPTPNLEQPINVWEHLVNDINFARGADSPIPGEEQAELLKAWILATFFREELPTRPILTMLGESGSGKTTAAKRIVQMLEGINENVLSVEEDKPDFWRTVVAEHQVFCLDNLERTRARWLINGLDRIATGSLIEIRELYKTNAVYRIEPDCFVILTAVNMPFSKDTLFQRLLALNMEKLTSYIPQRIYEQRLKANINGLWGDLLLKLNDVVATLKTNTEAQLAVSLRMADFAQFCERIRPSGVVSGHTLKSGLSVLGNSQQLALAQSENSAYPLIQEWVETYPEDAAKWHTANELYAILAEMAGRLRRNFRWKDSRGLSSHINAMEEVLIQTLGCQVQDNYRYTKGRYLKGYRFKPLGDEEDELLANVPPQVGSNNEQGADNGITESKVPAKGKRGSPVTRSKPNA